jgi:uncharacterized SAM-binding protein YcdF (DUF218 family)
VPGPVTPARDRRSWPARIVLGLLVLGLGGCGVLFGWPPGGTPHEEGPVVVLGGGAGDRFALGRELAAASSPTRELVLSAEARDELEAAGGSCDDEGVRCVQPDPATTYGEAVLIGDLAEQQAWPAVTVVTSEFHVTRTRLVFSYCVDVPARVVASDSGLGLGSRVERALREAVATVATLPAYDCPGRPDQE